MFPLSSVILTDYDFFLFFSSTWTARIMNAGMVRKMQDSVTISKMPILRPLSLVEAEACEGCAYRVTV